MVLQLQLVYTWSFIVSFAVASSLITTSDFYWKSHDAWDKFKGLDRYQCVELYSASYCACDAIGTCSALYASLSCSVYIGGLSAFQQECLWCVADSLCLALANVFVARKLQDSLSVYHYSLAIEVIQIRTKRVPVHDCICCVIGSEQSVCQVWMNEPSGEKETQGNLVSICSSVANAEK